MTIFASLRQLTGAAAAFVTIFGAAPAFANSAAIDISGPIRATQADRPSGAPAADPEFRQLFASWRALDRGINLAAASVAVPVSRGFGIGGSVPSREPVDGFRLTSTFGMREHPVLGGYRAHKGVDLAVPAGTPIHAPGDGIVEKAEWFSSYGLFVAIDHGSSTETRFGHLSRLNVSAGQFVHKGDIIGYVGTTGRSTGPHLHYEVRVAGEAVNPLPYMQGGMGGFQLASATTTNVPTHVNMAAASGGDDGDGE
ncbi:MAG: M23 family metallopeptidase [Novosphingobium sp.]|nr:M23 family metallopeptidase [Novosphingobium sp.]